MNKLQRKRFEKLIKHLEVGELGVDKFDYSALYLETNCGTCGCALGECPTVFPEQWELGPLNGTRRDPTLQQNGTITEHDAAKFFGLISQEVEAVFFGNSLYTSIHGYLQSNFYSIEDCPNPPQATWLDYIGIYDVSKRRVINRMKKFLKIYDNPKYQKARKS